MKILVENFYSDGHSSKDVVDLDLPEPTLAQLNGKVDEPLVDQYGQEHADWWNAFVFEHTGDGHGAEVPGLGSCYIATIQEANKTELIGQSYEWSD